MEVSILRRPLKLTRSVHIIGSSQELPQRNDTIRQTLKIILFLVFAIITSTLGLCHSPIRAQLSSETKLAIPSGLVMIFIWVTTAVSLLFSRTIPVTHLPGLAPRIRYGRRHISRMHRDRYIHLIRKSSPSNAMLPQRRTPISIFVLGLLAASFLISINPSARVLKLYKQLADSTALPVSSSSHNLYHYAWSSSPLPSTATLLSVCLQEASTIHV